MRKTCNTKPTINSRPIVRVVGTIVFILTSFYLFHSFSQIAHKLLVVCSILVRIHSLHFALSLFSSLYVSQVKGRGSSLLNELLLLLCAHLDIPTLPSLVELLFQGKSAEHRATQKNERGHICTLLFRCCACNIIRSCVLEAGKQNCTQHVSIIILTG
uniref:Uncharacterized protein n=1 Tax=Rhodosorus marinus TaxID=101924 RepID=A0A7S3A7R1_9RHOD